MSNLSERKLKEGGGEVGGNEGERLWEGQRILEQFNASASCSYRPWRKRLGEYPALGETQ